MVYIQEPTKKEDAGLASSFFVLVSRNNVWLYDIVGCFRGKFPYRKIPRTYPAASHMRFIIHRGIKENFT